MRVLAARSTAKTRLLNRIARDTVLKELRRAKRGATPSIVRWDIYTGFGIGFLCACL
jgi:hypothetical protein